MFNKTVSVSQNSYTTTNGKVLKIRDLFEPGIISIHLVDGLKTINDHRKYYKNQIETIHHFILVKLKEKHKKL